jgi:hypothetical protein
VPLRIRAGAVRTVKRAGSSAAVASSQSIGMATGAPGRARGDSGAMAVAFGPLRNQSRNILPVRIASLGLTT